MTAETAQLAAAREGDEAAFVALTSPHRRALHAHCYRLLGSLDDADDALQETLLRAWRGLPGFTPRPSLGAWLHRIATNVCLRALERRGREAGVVHLQPYPDVPSGERGTLDHVVAGETLALAFVAALQVLTVRERVTLVLRDVLGWSAREAAELQGTTVAAANSALQRGRARLEAARRAGTLVRDHRPAGPEAEARVMRAFLDAWNAADFPRLLALLADDALLTMPPDRVEIAGARAIVEFFSTVPLGGRTDQLPLRAARANGQPALGAYADEAGEGVRRPYGVMVFALAGDRIAGITGFPRQAQLFAALGLPDRVG